jgi:hypothetical protein
MKNQTEIPQNQLDMSWLESSLGAWSNAWSPAWKNLSMAANSSGPPTAITHPQARRDVFRSRA